MASRKKSRFEWLNVRAQFLAAIVAVATGVASFFVGDKVGESQTREKVEEAQALLRGVGERLSAGTADPQALSHVGDAVQELLQNPAESETMALQPDRRILSGSFWVPENGGRALTDANISLNVIAVTGRQLSFSLAGRLYGLQNSRDVRLPPPKENCILNLVTPILAQSGAGGGGVFRLTCA